MGSSIADKDTECTRVFVTIKHETDPGPIPQLISKIRYASENQAKFATWLTGAQVSHSIPYLHVWSGLILQSE
jgi:hypothetical protein